jgi:ribosome-associated heat shock protein Hsp15
MPDDKSIRIDKFLWAIRIYKTRSMASEACRKGKIVINNVQVKPSKLVAKNDIIIVRKIPVIYTYRIIEIVEKRVSAKLVDTYIEDLTSREEKAKFGINITGGFGLRDKGAGRPTKKERRSIDRLKDDYNNH